LNKNKSGEIYLEDPEARKYTQFTCVTSDNKLGTICKDTKGDCKKQACIAVDSTITTSKIYSIKEAELVAETHAAKMVQIGSISQKSFTASKALMKKMLLDNNAKLELNKK
jgi:hypothetical protein